MQTKYHEIYSLAGETVKRVTANGQEWMKYLATAARLYKYPFEDQILIYAQKPETTACASIKICPVWSGGKGGDNFKALPIAIVPLYKNA